MRYTCYKEGCVFPVVVVPMLSHAEFGPNDHQEDASHFTFSGDIMSMSLLCAGIHAAKFRMISDIDLSDGWEGPIWISKSDKAKMPNFEYVASNGRGQILLCAVDLAFLHIFESRKDHL